MDCVVTEVFNNRELCIRAVFRAIKRPADRNASQLRGTGNTGLWRWLQGKRRDDLRVHAIKLRFLRLGGGRVRHG